MQGGLVDGGRRDVFFLERLDSVVQVLGGGVDVGLRRVGVRVHGLRRVKGGVHGGDGVVGVLRGIDGLGVGDGLLQLGLVHDRGGRLLAGLHDAHGGGQIRQRVQDVGRAGGHGDGQDVVLGVQPLRGLELHALGRGERSCAGQDRVRVGLHLLAHGGGLHGLVIDERGELGIGGDPGVIARLVGVLLGLLLLIAGLGLADESFVGLDPLSQEVRQIGDVCRQLVQNGLVDRGEIQLVEQRADERNRHFDAAVTAVERGLQRVIDDLLFRNGAGGGFADAGLLGEIEELVVIVELRKRLVVGVLGLIERLGAACHGGLQAAEIIQLHREAADLLVERIAVPVAGDAACGHRLDEDGHGRAGDVIAAGLGGREGEPLALDGFARGQLRARDRRDGHGPFAAVIVSLGTFQLYGVACALDEIEHIIIDLLRSAVGARCGDRHSGVIDRLAALLGRQGRARFAVLRHGDGIQAALRGRILRRRMCSAGLHCIGERVQRQHAQAQQQRQNRFDMLHLPNLSFGAGSARAHIYT